MPELNSLPWRSIAEAYNPETGDPLFDTIIGYHKQTGVNTYYWDEEKFHKRPRPFWVSHSIAMGKTWSRMHQPTHFMPCLGPEENV